MFASKDLFFSKPSGYQISRSVRLRSSASAYLNRTPASAGNQKTWTWSAWVKRGTLGTRQNIFGASTGGSSDTQYCLIAFTAGDVIAATAANAGTTQLDYSTSAVFRDPSAWYHIVIYFDAVNTTFRIYVNGVLQTLTTSTAISNVNYSVNSAVQHNIGKDVRATTNTSYVDGYLTEINFIDGQALTPSSFGQVNVYGVWSPIKYTGTYGTNGFYLNFSDNSAATAAAIGKDYSGNGNNWTPNNISVTAGATYDSMLDVPTPYADGGNGRGNYAVWNPLSVVSPTTLADGNLGVVTGTTGGGGAFSTITIPTSGKYYFEFIATAVSATLSDNARIGLATASVGNYVLYKSDGNKVVDGTTSAYGSSFALNDVIGCAIDVDGGTVTFYKNNVTQGSITYSTSNGNYFAYTQDGSGTVSVTANINFGQRPFTYTPPSGYSALNTQNLPTPTISNGANYMAASTYTGTLLSNSIVNSGNNTGAISFKPDLVWIKSRSAATDHKLTDSVRGVTKALISDTAGAETTDAQGLTAFNSNGFTVGTDTNYNNLSATYVAWQWQAGAGSSSSNTAGSITSTVSVNATAGFSIVTYTGTGANATVGHGLGVAPSMVIVKQRTAASTTNWQVRHTSITAANSIQLNLTNAAAAAATVWNSTAPTSTVFSIGTDTSVNVNTGTYVAYCFSAVAGYSAFGSYTGNGSADGPFVYCGFRPRWIMIKCSSTGGVGYEWYLVDSSRNTYNVTNLVLYPNLSDAEATAGSAILDILSNGFKLRGSANIQNASSATYIFAAFAENPFKNSLAR